MNRRGEWIAITLILLLAAALRFWRLGEVPPGLCHDEVTNTLIARGILSGHHAIFVAAGWGRETLYHYVQAVTIALFGGHWLGIRYPAAAFGLFGLAITYTLIRRLFNAPTALLSSGWLATSFWPILYARISLRAISLPAIGALSAYFLLRATNLQSPNQQTQNPRTGKSHRFVGSGFTDWLLAGIFLGLSIYTYTSSRILPAILIFFLAYYILVHRPTPIPWTRLGAFLLSAAAVSAPLIVWLTGHPDAEYRISEVREPLDRLFAGDLTLVWHNLIANLKFFTVTGDPWGHYNYLRRPVFADPVSAALFYIGLFFTLRRWRIPRYGFLLTWLFGALMPSIVTAAPPSSVRDILALVVVFVFPALGLVEMGRWIELKLKKRSPKRSPRSRSHASRILPPIAGLLALAPCLFLTVRDYFIRWPVDDVVRFFYQTDLTAVAHRLDELPANRPVSIAGLSVHSLDRPSLDLTARRDVDDVRLCDTRETLIIPSGHDVLLFVPHIVPFDDDLRQRLLRWGGVEESSSQSLFASYRLRDEAKLRRDLEDLEKEDITLPDAKSVTLPVSFGGRLAFLGYEWLQPTPTPGDSLTLLTYWRVEEPSLDQLKVFVHLTGESDAPIAQHDGLGSPAHGWASGDVVIQKHIIPLPADLVPGYYRLQMGVYDVVTNARLPVLMADRVLLREFEVAE